MQEIAIMWPSWPTPCNATIKPNTVAEPCMSNFISSIPAPGFNEIPPVSKVIPLPTTIGQGPSFALAFNSQITMQGGCSLPFPTFMRPPILFSRSSSHSNTVTDKLPFPLANALAREAYSIGVSLLAGSLPRSLAMCTPVAIADTRAHPAVRLSR